MNRRVPATSTTLPTLTVRHQSSAPATILDKSLWQSIVPKPLRKGNRQKLAKKSRRWNPATFYIVMFLLIGSMSIQMIALRNSFARYMRQSDIKIARLKEVVDKIQKGETVDVEKMLGTGDPQKEADWEEGEACLKHQNVADHELTRGVVLKQIERDDKSNKTPKRGRKKRQAEAEPEEPSKVEETAQSQSTIQATGKPASFGNFF